MLLDDQLPGFPDPSMADHDGVLAIGGDLSPERLLLAYRSGIFPWFSGSTPVWYAPDPRFVLFPTELYISKSMKVLLKRGAFRVTINQHFAGVIRACKITEREGQQGTWITSAMEKAYIRLHKAGYAESVEAWNGDRLAGGLYGVRIGNVFFGESMFSHESNASKYAFITYVQHLINQQVALIDCQIHTPHLESLGGRSVPRRDFMALLKTHC